MHQLSIEKRLRLVKAIVCIAFVLGISLSSRLWLTDRTFPLAPAFDFLPSVISPFDLLLAGLLVAFLLISGFLRDKLFIILSFCLLAVLLLTDQNRLQPWVYTYVLILFPFLFWKNDDKFHAGLFNYLQLVFAGIYVWSGIQKINPNFSEFTFQSMITDLFGIKDPGSVAALKKLWLAVPLFEIAAGIMLLMTRTRETGVILIITIHLFILIYLSPAGIDHNTVVYPWNIAMIVLACLLFYRTDNKLYVWRKGDIKASVLSIAAALLVWIMPLFNFAGRWDNYLSFALYSDKLPEYFIAIEENETGRIEDRFSPYYVSVEGLQGGKIINVTKWSMAELNVPMYAERRVFEKVAAMFCRMGIPAGKVIFIGFQRPLRDGKFYSFTCKDISL